MHKIELGCMCVCIYIYMHMCMPVCEWIHWVFVLCHIHTFTRTRRMLHVFMCRYTHCRVFANLTDLVRSAIMGFSCLYWNAYYVSICCVACVLCDGVCLSMCGWVEIFGPCMRRAINSFAKFFYILSVKTWITSQLYMCVYVCVCVCEHACIHTYRIYVYMTADHEGGACWSCVKGLHHHEHVMSLRTCVANQSKKRKLHDLVCSIFHWKIFLRISWPYDVHQKECVMPAYNMRVQHDSNMMCVDGCVEFLPVYKKLAQHDGRECLSFLSPSSKILFPR